MKRLGRSQHQLFKVLAIRDMHGTSQQRHDLESGGLSIFVMFLELASRFHDSLSEWQYA